MTAQPPSEPTEPTITQDLVRSLLAEQHPDLIERVGVAVPDPQDWVTGWDNTMIRLGDDLAVRLPRRDLGEQLLLVEQTWLPALAEQTGLKLPVPMRTGVPSPDYRYHWSVVPWTPGTTALELPVAERGHYARELALVLARLHCPAPPDSPVSPVGRGGDIGAMAQTISERLDEHTASLGNILAQELKVVLHRAVSARPYSGPGLWLHGDPHTGNTVIRQDGRPVLIDFGDLCQGDPASDLGMVWDHFDPPGVEEFRSAYQPAAGGAEVDTALWDRARGWALHYGLIFLGSDHAGFADRGHRILAQISSTRGPG